MGCISLILERRAMTVAGFNTSIYQEPLEKAGFRIRVEVVSCQWNKVIKPFFHARGAIHERP